MRKTLAVALAMLVAMPALADEGYTDADIEAVLDTFADFVVPSREAITAYLDQAYDFGVGEQALDILNAYPMFGPVSPAELSAHMEQGRDIPAGQVEVLINLIPFPWDHHAAFAAEMTMELNPMECSDLIEFISSHGFTQAQAETGAATAGAC